MSRKRMMKPSEFDRVRNIGDINITLPEPPKDKTEILFHDKPVKDQKWEPTKIPKHWDALPEREKLDFLKREFKRREEGIFFYNNGNIEYMTGIHYFYCSYWKIDIGLPSWWDSDRDFFYFWDFCVKDPDCYGAMYITGRRMGKALDIDTPIPTPNGWTTMEYIKEGDIVFSSKGEETKVTFATDIQYDRQCYELTFSDGSKLFADADHQWIAYNKSSRKNISHPKWKAKKHVVTTQHMYETQKVGGKNESNWSIENCLPVKYSEKNLSIDPYILGLWLGDGHSSGYRFTNVDQELIDSYREYMESIGMKLDVTSYEDITYYSSGKNGKGRNIFLEKLREYNLQNNKYIPDEYLQGSVEQRFDLLKGLMDTDGSVHVNGSTCEFCTKFENLSLEVMELITSLGYKATRTTKYNKKVGRDYYYVRFSHGGKIPFKLPRKINQCKPVDKSGWRHNHRYIVDIKPIETRPVKCIEVDSDDHSYLCGENYITTHNTAKATCILYEATSKIKSRNSGIQSKTNKDGKTVFKKLIQSWKRLPKFWKPTDTGETNPSSALRFEEPSKRSTKGDVKEYKDVLDSYIDYMPSVEEAYDGTKQYRLLHDEVGKQSDADVWERWYICKPCFELGRKIVGKALLTTTVEEIDKDGGNPCKKLWDESVYDLKNTQPDGRTISGLYRYFKPAYQGLEGFIDEYGYSVVKDPETPVMGLDGEMIDIGARTYLDNIRAGRKGKNLSSIKRKFPYTSEEAFRIDNRYSPFDTDKVYQQLDYNSSLPPSTVVRGNFVWRTKDKEVIWHPQEDGRWYMAWMPQANDRENQNAVKVSYGKMEPLNYNIVSGVDPYDHARTTEKGSDAASYVFRKLDPLDPDNTHCFVCQYVARPPDPHIFYEDMIKQSFFYGCELLAENNRPGLINYFKQRGYDRFLMRRPDPTHTAYSKQKQKDPGIPMSGAGARDALISAIESYVYNHVGQDEEGVYGKCFFDKLLNDWVEFEVDNWTPYDCTVASGLALLAANKHNRRKDDDDDDDHTFFRIYKQ